MNYEKKYKEALERAKRLYGEGKINESLSYVFPELKDNDAMIRRNIIAAIKKVINVKILHLVLKKKWYEMQECGEKTEEYREITAYWYQRLYQRKKEFGFAGRLTREDAEYACAPDARYILKGDGFCDTELKPYTHVCFHYGYTDRCFIRKIDSIIIGRGNPDWGAPKYRDVIIIRHHKEDSPSTLAKISKL